MYPATGACACLLYTSAYYLYVQFNLGVDQLAKNMLIRTWDGVKWSIDYYDGDCQDVYKRQGTG